MITDLTVWQHVEHWHCMHGQRQSEGFLEKKPYAIKADELFNLCRKQVRIMTGLLTGHCHLKGHLFKLGW